MLPLMAGYAHDMSIERWISLVGGVSALVLGVNAVMTRRVAIQDESDDEPHLWLYGRRAVAIGIIGLLVSAFLFAAAAGVISLERP
jgi:hypothetical protein